MAVDIAVRNGADRMACGKTSERTNPFANQCCYGRRRSCCETVQNGPHSPIQALENAERHCDATKMNLWAHLQKGPFISRKMARHHALGRT
ncbi:hypothetical protein PAXRUDRAFT_829661 [Paxillus rubicundulus Ve08.2h10]|uniref:Unplaced genomic scaffold scaffold_424, whole genome shotgun sequence n=1 Tax=Paxillus rubicundulus Ve08.2h10 TaxID=930991 RepID=A0A0D0DUJ2_9AGAM|nr:hypothetical protein PAXRUDRAFT_829661 [Paxillus rubicundulus Ve08.2h10]